jgi:hypothetical protein
MMPNDHAIYNCSTKEDRCRCKETLIEAMGRALGTVLTEDVRGFLAHCGYRVPAQQL